jgi:hypothetical protein
MADPHPQRLRLYTLLYIDDAETWNSNIGNGRLSNKDVYIRCASRLSASCLRHGFQVEILTNEPGYVNARLAELGQPEIALGLMFSRDVPKGIPFYAAHFKLDAIRRLGSGEFGDYVGLIDNDVVMLKAPAIDLDAWEDRRLFLYDITGTVVEEYGHDLVGSDLERVAGTRLDHPKWYGGEFIAGSQSAFRALSERIESLWPAYREIAAGLHHVGDEIIVSAAINMLRDEDRIAVTNVGDEDHLWISRWFSARTGFIQQPFSHHLRSSMLHLPSDKRFIAASALHPFEASPFISRYKIHLKRKLLARTVLNYVNLLRGQPRRQVPRLS